MRYLRVIICTFLCLVTQTVLASSAVILIYHRFGESQYPSTSIRISQFEAQLHFLHEQGYRVLPVPAIIEALKAGKPLPDKTVGITIDDAYESVYTQAWPLLKKWGYPFTLFVATDPIDKGYRGMMSWAQISELAAAGVTIGNHSTTHPHFPNLSISQVHHEIEKAQQVLMLHLNKAPSLFAYPYGEYSPDIAKAVKQAGFLAAFAQVSGPVGHDSDFFALPRFSQNEHYADMDRFRLIINTLPLPMDKLQPDSPILEKNPPSISFTVPDIALNLNQLNCYATDQGPLAITLKNRAVILSAAVFNQRRVHINCTLRNGAGQWYWLGLIFIQPSVAE